MSWRTIRQNRQCSVLVSLNTSQILIWSKMHVTLSKFRRIKQDFLLLKVLGALLRSRCLWKIVMVFGSLHIVCIWGPIRSNPCNCCCFPSSVLASFVSRLFDCSSSLLLCQFTDFGTSPRWYCRSERPDVRCRTVPPRPRRCRHLCPKLTPPGAGCRPTVQIASCRCRSEAAGNP